jgi:anti-sigma regulatory factor (Ser/Thr protein kinase)
VNGTLTRPEQISAAPFMALISLPRTRPTVAAARRWLTNTLTAWGVSGDQLDDAVLALSEVVTNAVVHAVGDGHSTVTAALWQGHLRVTVSDPDPELHDPARSDEHGRGLLVVQKVTMRHGANRLVGGGKLIWFEQLLTAPGAPAYGCPDCKHLPGCGCDCCPYPLPAVAAVQLVGGAR